MTRDRAEPAIEAASAAFTACAVAFLVLSGAMVATQPGEPAPNAVTTVALTIAPAPPPAPQPPSVAPQPAPPQPQPAPQSPAPAAPPSPHATLAQPQPRLHRRPPPPRPTTHPDPAPQAATAPIAPAATPQPRAPTSANAESLYATLVRGTIERNKRNPESPVYHLLHPHGIATIRFMVSRTGAPSAIEVISSAGSALLDRQAALIVSASRFPAMPAALFAGAPGHSFQVEINFPPFLPG
jgi:TonB family protein